MTSTRKLKIIIDQAGDAGPGLKGIAGSLSALGPAGVAAIAVAGLATVGVAGFKVGQKLVALGADAEEMESKFNVVFGDSAIQATKALDEFGNVVGRNKFELMEMASTVQDTFVPLGFARDKAAGMSVELSKLAVDVASFNNESDPEVMKAFQSAIVGNHETVRKYGIIITQATLNAELMRMGVAEGIKTATEQEKVQARLNLIYAGTTDAQGDAAETAGSWTNQMRALKSEIKENATAIGGELLPFVTPLLTGFTTMVRKILPPMIEGFKHFASLLREKMAPIMERVKEALGRISDSMELAKAGSWVLKAAFDVLSFGFDAAIWVIDKVVLVFEGLSYAIAGVRAAIDWLIRVWNDMKHRIESGINLPDWLTPGSPTPLELGLRGIGAEMDRLNMGGLTVAAGAGAGAMAGAGGVTWTGDFVYSPAVSLGDRLEAEEKIVPALLAALKRAGINV